MERMKRTKTHVRLDQWLSQKHPDESRSFWQKRIKRGDVRVNGRKVTSHYMLREDDKIEIAPSRPTVSFAPTTDSPTPLSILFEGENYLVINKPAGLVVHPGSGHVGRGDTLAEILTGYTGTLSTAGGEERPGIVHRLDKDTSGVMVIAKTNAAHRDLTKQFAEKKVKKEYIALVHGHVEPREGSIEAPLTRNQKNRTKIQVSTGQKSRYALTHYRVKKIFTLPFPASLLSVRIETGRTHQIRVHLEAIGHPVVGDQVYTRRSEHALDQALGLPHQFLHAQQLELISPTTNKTVSYSSEIPEELEKILKVFRS